MSQYVCVTTYYGTLHLSLLVHIDCCRLLSELTRRERIWSMVMCELHTYARNHTNPDTPNQYPKHVPNAVPINVPSSCRKVYRISAVKLYKLVHCTVHVLINTLIQSQTNRLSTIKWKRATKKAFSEILDNP